MKRQHLTKTGFLILLALSKGAFAGDGHDHGVPGAVAAPKGGDIKPAMGSFFELLKTKDVIKVYPYDDKLKPISLDLITDIGATAQLPKGKVEKIEVVKHNDHLMMSYDAKKSHRFELVIKFKVKGKADTVTYNVEKH